MTTSPEPDGTQPAAEAPGSGVPSMAATLEVRAARTDALIEGLEAAAQVVHLGQVAQLRLAVGWVLAHPADRGGRREWYDPKVVPAGGPGTPETDEYSLAELTEVLGLSTAAVQDLVADASDLAFRLPGTWAQVIAGVTSVAQARYVARGTQALNEAAAAAVDEAVTSLRPGTRIGRVRLERMIGAAIAAHDPDLAEQVHASAAGGRHVTVDTGCEVGEGIGRVLAILDTPDALALERAVSAGADRRAAAGEDAAREVLRAKALGDIARDSLTGTRVPGGERPAEPRGAGSGGPAAPGSSDDASPGTLSSAPGAPTRPEARTESGPQPEPGTRRRPGEPPRPGTPSRLGPQPVPGIRPEPGTPFRLGAQPAPGTRARSGRPADAGSVLMYLHVDAADLAGLAGHGPVTCQGPGLAGITVTVATIRDWLADSLAGTPVNVRPVIDLREESETGGYEFTPRQREAIGLRTPTCCFPHCHRQARACDVDHTRPWSPGGAGGATCTCDGAPLCREHHRLKTHADQAGPGHTSWSYVSLGAGEHHWVGPRGRQFITGPDGTARLTEPARPIPRAEAARPARGGAPPGRE